MSTHTTIKVPSELRDALQHRARDERRSMADVVQSLLESDERARLFARMRVERAGDAVLDGEWERAALQDTGE